MLSHDNLSTETRNLARTISIYGSSAFLTISILRSPSLPSARSTSRAWLAVLRAGRKALRRFWRLVRFWLVSACRDKGKGGRDVEGVRVTLSGATVAGSEGDRQLEESVSLLVVEISPEPDPRTKSVFRIPSRLFAAGRIRSAPEASR